MPIYEYKCEKCQHEFEELVRGESNSVVCPQCGSGDLKRLFSVFGFRSSGGGGSSSSSSACSTCTTGTCSTCDQ